MRRRCGRFSISGPDLVRQMQEEWMAEVEKCRALPAGSRHRADACGRPVRRGDEGRDRRGCGTGSADARSRSDFTFLIEDPATVWNLGPQRYPEIAKRYAPLTPKPERLAIDINIVDRYQDVYPTKQQTGTELFELVHLASAAFPRVALYFENSILRPDLALLPSAAAVVNRVERVGQKTVIDAPYGVGIPWHGQALVDGKTWPALSESTLWLPAGTHSVEPGTKSPSAHLLDFNGTLQGAEARSDRRIDISYTSSSRAVALLDRNPLRVEVDGVQVKANVAGAALLLPRGQHNATIQTE